MASLAATSSRSLLLGRSACGCRRVVSIAAGTSASSSSPSNYVVGGLASAQLRRQSSYATSELPATASGVPHRTGAKPRTSIPSSTSSSTSRLPKWQPTEDRAQQVQGISPLTAKVLGSAGILASKTSEKQAAKRSSPDALRQRGFADSDPQMEGRYQPKPSSAVPQSLAGRQNQAYEEASTDGDSTFSSRAGQQPCTPTSARSLAIQSSDQFARQYRRLMSGVIVANNVRTELRFQERYEKPKYRRQRLASSRHRRRFAREVGMKVAAVMRAKRQGM